MICLKDLVVLSVTNEAGNCLSNDELGYNNLTHLLEKGDLKMLAFTIMDKHDPLIHITVDDEQNITLNALSNEQVPYLPSNLYSSAITMEQLNDFFESRCVPRTRVNIDELLDKMGLPFYHPLSIIQKTHGLITDDFIWIKFDGEAIDYDDIRIR